MDINLFAVGLVALALFLAMGAVIVKLLKQTELAEAEVKKAQVDLKLAEENYIHACQRLNNMEQQMATRIEAEVNKNTLLNATLEGIRTELVEMQNAASMVSNDSQFVLLTKSEICTIVRNHNNRVERAASVCPSAKPIKETSEDFVNRFAPVDYTNDKSTGRYYIFGIDFMI